MTGMAMFEKMSRGVQGIVGKIGSVALIMFGFLLVFSSTHSKAGTAQSQDGIFGADVAHADAPYDPNSCTTGDCVACAACTSDGGAGCGTGGCTGGADGSGAGGSCAGDCDSGDGGCGCGASG